MYANILTITHRYGRIVASLMNTSLELPSPSDIAPEFFYELINNQRMTITDKAILVDGKKLYLSKADVLAFKAWLNIERIEATTIVKVVPKSL